MVAGHHQRQHQSREKLKEIMQDQQMWKDLAHRTVRLNRMDNITILSQHQFACAVHVYTQSYGQVIPGGRNPLSVHFLSNVPL